MKTKKFINLELKTTMNNTELIKTIDLALKEDIKGGDHSTLACIASSELGEAKLIVKQEGCLAGVAMAEIIFKHYDSEITFEGSILDGEMVRHGDIAFKVKGKVHTILACERLVLNVMQRMSGIATYTKFLNSKIKDTGAKLLDTRKTTPNFRIFEKEAVRIAGAVNHRFGLYDMVMLKDNHIDYAGGISNAILKTKTYLEKEKLDLKVEVEVRDLEELDQVLQTGQVHRIMLDNFDPETMAIAVKRIGGKYETEASGGKNEKDLRNYALTGVDYISVGALTHQVKSLDLSL